MHSFLASDHNNPEGFFIVQLPHPFQSSRRTRPGISPVPAACVSPNKLLSLRRYDIRYYLRGDAQPPNERPQPPRRTFFSPTTACFPAFLLHPLNYLRRSFSGPTAAPVPILPPHGLPFPRREIFNPSSAPAACVSPNRLLPLRRSSYSRSAEVI